MGKGINVAFLWINIPLVIHDDLKINFISYLFVYKDLPRLCTQLSYSYPFVDAQNYNLADMRSIR